MKTKKSLDVRGFRQSGISLVEIMVAMVLSLVLLAGVGQIYVGSKQTYRVQDGQSRLQENGRYALDLLTKDIRETGLQGCRSMSSITPNVIALAPGNNFALATVITGNEASSTDWSPGLSATLNNVLTGTDVITVQFASSCGGTPISAATTASVTLPATNTCAVTPSSNCGTGSCKGDILILSDCQSVHVFRADTATPTSSSNPTVISITGTAVNSSSQFLVQQLPKTYNTASTELMHFNSNTYFIRLNPNNEPALWRLDNTAATGGSNPVELVEGIENMQILYGVDTDADNTPNQFVTADLVANWSQVVGVQVTLTARSVGESADNLTSAPNAARPYNGNNNYVDSRLHKDFAVTISLRNRQQ